MDRNKNLDPIGVKLTKITHTGSCNRISWIGLQVLVTLRNGEVVYCDHNHGHRTKEAAVSCATKLVARLNRAAGTSTAEVMAAAKA